MSNISGRISGLIRSTIQRVNTQGAKGAFGGAKAVRNSISTPKTTSISLQNSSAQRFSVQDFSRTVLNGLSGYQARSTQADTSQLSSFSNRVNQQEGGSSSSSGVGGTAAFLTGKNPKIEAQILLSNITDDAGGARALEYINKSPVKTNIEFRQTLMAEVDAKIAQNHKAAVDTAKAADKAAGTPNHLKLIDAATKKLDHANQQKKILNKFNRMLKGETDALIKAQKPETDTISKSEAKKHASDTQKSNKAFARNMVRLIHDKDSAASQLSLLRDHEASAGLEKSELKSLHRALKYEVKRGLFHDIKLMLTIRKEMSVAKKQGDKQTLLELRSKLREVGADAKALIHFSKSISGTRRPSEAFVKGMVESIYDKDSVKTQLTLLKDHEASMSLNKSEVKSLHRALKKEARKGIMNDILLMLTIRKEMKAAKKQGDQQRLLELRSKMKEVGVDARALGKFTRSL